MGRYAIIIEYDGESYSGWQRQPFLSATLQEAAEVALGRVADHRVELFCAGRTDAGVHALGQVAHFDTIACRKTHAWLAGGNTYLPPDIRLQAIVPVRADFHARYDARRRHYRYLIDNGEQPSALFRNRCHWYRKLLDTEKMARAARLLVGEHDFSAFRGAQCQARNPFRFIESVSVLRRASWVIVDICGNAFLHHMVRNIVGSLLAVGDGRRQDNWLKAVLESRDRQQAGVTAPAQGLYLHHIDYPKADGIPSHRPGDLPIA